MDGAMVDPNAMACCMAPIMELHGTHRRPMDYAMNHAIYAINHPMDDDSSMAWFMGNAMDVYGFVHGSSMDPSMVYPNNVKSHTRRLLRVIIRTWCLVSCPHQGTRKNDPMEMLAPSHDSVLSSVEQYRAVRSFLTGEWMARPRLSTDFPHDH